MFQKKVVFGCFWYWFLNLLLVTLLLLLLLLLRSEFLYYIHTIHGLKYNYRGRWRRPTATTGQSSVGLAVVVVLVRWIYFLLLSKRTNLRARARAKSATGCVGARTMCFHLWRLVSGCSGCETLWIFVREKTGTFVCEKASRLVYQKAGRVVR